MKITIGILLFIICIISYSHEDIRIKKNNLFNDYELYSDKYYELLKKIKTNDTDVFYISRQDLKTVVDMGNHQL